MPVHQFFRRSVAAYTVEKYFAYTRPIARSARVHNEKCTNKPKSKERLSCQSISYFVKKSSWVSNPQRNAHDIAAIFAALNCVRDIQSNRCQIQAHLTFQPHHCDPHPRIAAQCPSVHIPKSKTPLESTAVSYNLLRERLRHVLSTGRAHRLTAACMAHDIVAACLLQGLSHGLDCKLAM